MTVLVVEFTVPGNPRPWERTGTRPGGRRYTPRVTSATEQAVAWEARGAMKSRERATVPLSVDIAFYRSTAHACDIDNLAKAVLDGLNGVVWRDDAQVIDLTLRKRVDRARPRTEVKVWAA